VGLVRRFARDAGIETWDRLSPHSLRHSAITLALDARTSLREVQDFAGHNDPHNQVRRQHRRHHADRARPADPRRVYHA
jgi:integrase